MTAYRSLLGTIHTIPRGTDSKFHCPAPHCPYANANSGSMGDHARKQHQIKSAKRNHADAESGDEANFKFTSPGRSTPSLKRVRTNDVPVEDTESFDAVEEGYSSGEGYHSDTSIWNGFDSDSQSSTVGMDEDADQWDLTGLEDPPVFYEEHFGQVPPSALGESLMTIGDFAIWLISLCLSCRVFALLGVYPFCSVGGRVHRTSGPRHDTTAKTFIQFGLCGFEGTQGGSLHRVQMLHWHGIFVFARQVHP